MSPHRPSARAVVASLTVSAVTAVLLAAPVHALALDAGDVAVIGVRTDGSAPTANSFAWVPLVDLAPGAQISFTDSGWTAAGAFRPQEGAITYTAPTAGLPAGTVMSLGFSATPYSFSPTGGGGTYVGADGPDIGTAGLVLDTAGDQLIVFEGAAATPNILWAWQNNGPYAADASSDATSAIPRGLVLGTSAVSVSAAGENFTRYTGATSGTRETLGAALADPGLWEASETLPFPTGGSDLTNGATPGGFAVNAAPRVNAGDDQSISLPSTIVLSGEITDDGLPSSPGVVVAGWSKIFGPGEVAFNDVSSAATSASFSEPGLYTLSLAANDGELLATDEINVRVAPSPVTFAPVCRTQGAAAEDRSGTKGASKLRFSAAQLRINQNIGSAAVRRANAIQAWLDEGIVGSDICGGALDRMDLDQRISTTIGPLRGEPTPPSPRAFRVARAARKDGVRFSLTRHQLRN